MDMREEIEKGLRRYPNIGILSKEQVEHLVAEAGKAERLQEKINCIVEYLKSQWCLTHDELVALRKKLEEDAEDGTHRG